MQISSTFPLGRLVATATVLGAVPNEEITSALARHAARDWGDLDATDLRLNDEALGAGGRILSAFSTSAGKIWIITEADRSATTVLFPADY